MKRAPSTVRIEVQVDPEKLEDVVDALECFLERVGQKGLILDADIHMEAQPPEANGIGSSMPTTMVQ